MNQTQNKKDLLKYYKFIKKCKVEGCNLWYGTDQKKEPKSSKGRCPIHSRCDYRSVQRMLSFQKGETK